MAVSYGRYIAVETVISIVINVAISALFMAVVFGRAASIELWGGRGLALDFIPQTFMISAMSILVPTLLTRRRIRRGALAGYKLDAVPFINSLAVRILLIACLLTLILGGAGVAMLSSSWTGPLRFGQVIPIKLAYGGVVALIATPIGLLMALAEEQADKRDHTA